MSRGTRLAALVITLVLLAGPPAGRAQPPAGVPTIAILRCIRDAEREPALRDAFRERGGTEGRNIVAGTRLEFLREALPDVRPVGAVLDRGGAPSLLVQAQRTVP